MLELPHRYGYLDFIRHFHKVGLIRSAVLRKEQYGTEQHEALKG